MRRNLLQTNDSLACDGNITTIPFEWNWQIVVDTLDDVDFVRYVMQDNDQLDWIANDLKSDIIQSGLFNDTPIDIDCITAKITQIGDITSERREYTLPTSPPTNAPTVPPTNAPSNAPTLAPTFCDQSIHNWLVNDHFTSDEEFIRVYSPCDDLMWPNNNYIEHSNYFIKFSFQDIEEVGNYINSDNDVIYYSVGKSFTHLKFDITTLNWSHNYGYFGIIPYLEILGSGYIDYKDWNVQDSVSFDVKFTIFYQKYESVYENGIAIDISMSDWPFNYYLNDIKIHIDLDIGAFPDAPVYYPIYDQGEKAPLSELKEAEYEYILLDELYYLMLSKTCIVDGNNQVDVVVKHQLQSNNGISLDIILPYFSDNIEYISQNGIYHD